VDKEYIDNILLELLSRADEIYGEAVEKIWFYDGDLCPSCMKRKIDALVIGKDPALSLNAFIYRDLNTLIGYFLCSHCATDVFAKGEKHKELYHNLEENLKTAYHIYLKSQAS
jgi:hypothetical protein